MCRCILCLLTQVVGFLWYKRLMEEIPNNHLTWMKPCKYWNIYHINWCRISSISSMVVNLEVNQPTTTTTTTTTTTRSSVGNQFFKMPGTGQAIRQWLGRPRLVGFAWLNDIGSDAEGIPSHMVVK